MEAWRRTLDELVAQRARAAPIAPPAVAAPASPRPALESVLGGEAERHGGSACWVIRTNACAATGAAERVAVSDSAAPIALEQLAILDIETGGFSGSPVLLVGILSFDGGRATTVQYLARDYAEEVAVLAGTAALLAARPVWCSFNGRSFDAPFLSDRAALHRMPWPSPQRHVDVLHAARRRWGGQHGDCRLTTLEREVLGRSRLDDVSGREAADLLHAFMRTGSATLIAPVLEHNRADLRTTYELLARL